MVKIVIDYILLLILNKQEDYLIIQSMIHYFEQFHIYLLHMIE